VTAIIWKAVATGVAVVMLAMLASRLGPVVPVWLVAASAVILTPLAILDWWAVAVAVVIHRRKPQFGEVLNELDHMIRTATGGTLIAFLGASFLTGGLLPPGAGFVLLVAALLLFSGRPIIFLYRYYRK
jgi:hypothetical protein